MYYIWHIYYGYFGHSAAHLFVHAPEVPDVFRTFTQAPELFFFRISWTLLGHLLHLKYLFQIFRTFSTSFISAHSPDAPEVPHFFSDIYPSTRAIFIGYSGHSGHVLHLAYLFRIFRTLSTSFICACSGSSTCF